MNESYRVQFVSTKADVQSVTQTRTEDSHRQTTGHDTYVDVCQTPAEYDDYHSTHRQADRHY